MFTTQMIGRRIVTLFAVALAVAAVGAPLAGAASAGGAPPDALDRYLANQATPIPDAVDRYLMNRERTAGTSAPGNVAGRAETTVSPTASSAVDWSLALAVAGAFLAVVAAGAAVAYGRRGHREAAPSH